MTVRLRPMTDGEFGAWLWAARRDWAIERRNMGEPPDVAERIAADQFEQWFPTDARTDRHELFVVEDDDGVAVGRVWTGPHPQVPDNPAIAWLFDIELDPDRRGQGLGRQALVAVENRLRDTGVHQLGLNVFGGNEVARNLYRSAGYAEMAITMSKPLG